MPHESKINRIQTDGKFFRIGGERIWLRTVTYGPFPEDKKPDDAKEFERIKSAKFNSVRTFALPNADFLDAAQRAGLFVFAGLEWWQFCDFSARTEMFSAAQIKLSEWLKQHGTHPALASIYVGNEVPADLVRWMGPGFVKRSLESLISLGKEISPHLLFAYANYPSTEYLELGNADFTAFNIYLEKSEDFSAYLRRLQNIAGDRPLVISEFGLDSSRNSLQAQADTIAWGLEISKTEEVAGITIYAWSDLWQNGETEVLDWDFGITDRALVPKPAYEICSKFSNPSLLKPELRYSVIVCTRNGERYIGRCLEATRKLSGGAHEVIVVSDGSTDQTEEIVSQNFPEVRLLAIPPSGLSIARNRGAEIATGEILAFTDDDCEPDQEWLARLDRAFANPKIAAAGGPNLPPPARHWAEAVVISAPGAPSHVLLDDTSAEHLPGCNIAVRKSVFAEIGGFDPDFRTAGDDVDFCWRLADEGYELGFVPGAFVWHWRRSSTRAFLKQQIGYGKAEKILLEKHPGRFSKHGEAQWKGFVYGGGVVRTADSSIIYHGPMGQAGYQSIVNRMLPLRPLDPRFSNPITELIRALVVQLQSTVRRFSRGRFFRLNWPKLVKPHSENTYEEISVYQADGSGRDQLLEQFISHNWRAGSDTSSWDLEKADTKILIATEQFQDGATNNLIRVWGDPEAVRDTLKHI